MSARLTYGELMRLVDDKATGVIYEHIEALRAQLAAVERERDERLAQVLYTRQERDATARLHIAAAQRAAALTEALTETVECLAALESPAGTHGHAVVQRARAALRATPGGHE